MQRTVIFDLLQQQPAAFQKLILAVLALLGALVALRVPLVTARDHAGAFVFPINILVLEIDRDGNRVNGVGLAQDLIRLGAWALELFLHLGRQLHQGLLRQRLRGFLFFLWRCFLE